MSSEILTHTFHNGLVLIGQPMEWLESAAFCFLTPAGCIADPPDMPGLSNLTCEMMQRGCGDRDSRQFVEALERLGVDTGSNVSTTHSSYTGAMLADRLFEALALHADLLQRPHIPEAQIDEGRLVCLQEVRAIEDDLHQKAMQALRGRIYADPYGRSPQGDASALERMTIEDVREHYAVTHGPNDTILSVAGSFDWPKLKDWVGEYFGDWIRIERPEIVETAPHGGYLHIDHPAEQTHVAIAYPSVPYRHRHYFQARGAVGVLSDGMSSRLFTQVREERGLCYTVYATINTLRDRAAILSYAATETERAQETLDVITSELVRLGEGVEQHELDRLKSRIKAALIMQQESSRARASSMAADWYYLDRVVPLEEVGARIDALTCDSINSYLTQNPPRDFAFVTIGSQKLEAPRGVS